MTFRTGTIHWVVPTGEFALGITATTKKGATLLRFSFDQIAFTTFIWAAAAGGIGQDPAAFGIICAAEKPAELTRTDYHLPATLGTFYIDFNRR